MAEAPRIQFPHHPPDALRSLVRRFGIAVGIIVVIALLTWLGRNGYSDADGKPISLLDAFYGTQRAQMARRATLVGGGERVSRRWLARPSLNAVEIRRQARVPGSHSFLGAI